MRAKTLTSLGLYSEAADAGAAVVIRRYSTSFGLACRLLDAPMRRDIENVYALVRVADEAVDGAAAEAGLPVAAVLAQLDRLEDETSTALSMGYSTNPVVHAFAQTARRAGIGEDLTAPFFASMRRDCDPHGHSVASLGDYIYGSAEVVGLMCLRVFLTGLSVLPAERLRLEQSARRLGAAFQKVNFLRDLGQDGEELGRAYFPGVDPARLTEAQKAALLADLRDDLDAALPGLRTLPARPRRAVALAHALFSELADRIEACPADVLVTTRVRVPGTVKLRLAVAALAGIGPAFAHDDAGQAARSEGRAA
ncbi:phytoene synthase [Sinomonas cellulolyticus]|uniref:Squalene/phytoene synthase family protein n=1 Tax=Sinomonas cellulolyticus TaxID=2801916 RepID=A0ABS1K658_9MICC|nr:MULTISPECIES: squalene/phytoene synthase family protein [Sinomonas]MBL0707033.1 squalene/phytoene synthase family protein [Sinomonas cellulolyticus]GHG54297.1 phytoene synthase [Sinomonas sp. KCTC 49339]